MFIGDLSRFVLSLTTALLSCFKNLAWLIKGHILGENYFICFSNTNLIFDHKMNFLNASSILILYVVDSLYTFQQ